MRRFILIKSNLWAWQIWNFPKSDKLTQNLKHPQTPFSLTQFHSCQNIEYYLRSLTPTLSTTEWKFHHCAGNFHKFSTIVLCSVKVFRAQLSSPREKLVSLKRKAMNFRISYQKYVAIIKMTRQNVIVWHCATVFPWNLFDNILEIYGRFDL